MGAITLLSMARYEISLITVQIWRARDISFVAFPKLVFKSEQVLNVGRIISIEYIKYNIEKCAFYFVSFPHFFIPNFFNTEDSFSAIKAISDFNDYEDVVMLAEVA